ncbi:uncharacterized protein V1516DRAFT_651093 [Lipomyces oligophaga]|uniref:uncharacterized protein n=1 Tax=Lipomyces oligophaga TaxID=45792 RepID=UPI0034CDCBEE
MEIENAVAYDFDEEFGASSNLTSDLQMTLSEVSPYESSYRHRQLSDGLDSSAGHNKSRDLDNAAHYAELCEACRRGDVVAVEGLVERYAVDVNATDAFDYTPLILASICGHFSVVQYLLQHGAICDRDTFQGARCIYGALTTQIRELLVKFDVAKAVDPTQPFAAHLAGLLSRPDKTSDILFTSIPDYKISAHRFVLAARSEVFRTALRDRWKSKRIVSLAASTDVRAFDLVIRHIYASDPTAALAAVASGKDSLISSVLSSTARKLGLSDLADALPVLVDPSAQKRREQRAELMRRAQDDFERFVRDQIIGRSRCITVSDSAHEDDDDVDTYVDSDCTADVFLQVDSDSQENVHVLYPVHRAMLMRSDYYMTMFSSSFVEGSCEYSSSTFMPIRQLPIISLPTTSDIAEVVLRYLYCDRVDVPGPIALDVLYTADLLLLDKLKTLAAITLSKTNEAEIALNSKSTSKKVILPDNTTTKLPPPLYADIYEILRAGWATRIDRLEQFAAQHFANNLTYFFNQPEFADIVMESARRIRSRDETDTIELIDDIRSYLAQKFGILTDIKDDFDESGKLIEGPGWRITNYEREYNHQLDLIDTLLDSLELDA